ncbi:MAG: hypothetical protein ACTSQ8_26095 [Candidatus Helarchaeota archaeon]
MHITHSYIGSLQGNFRYSFYLLFEDYIEAQSLFVKDFDLLLERFARNIGDTGVVVRPFLGDLEATRIHILSKDWTREEKFEFRNTPGLLVLDKDFDEFDPREHRWLYLNFSGKVYDSPVPIHEYEDILAELADNVSNPESDFFEEALPIIRKLKLAGVAEIFEAKPEIFGFSVDLKKAATILRETFS